MEPVGLFDFLASRVWERLYLSEGVKYDIHVKLKFYKIGLLEELVV